MTLIYRQTTAVGNGRHHPVAMRSPISEYLIRYHKAKNSIRKVSSSSGIYRNLVDSVKRQFTRLGWQVR